MIIYHHDNDIIVKILCNILKELIWTLSMSLVCKNIVMNYVSHNYISETISIKMLCLILNVSVSRACVLLWCIEIDHVFLRLYHKMIFYQSKLDKDITHADTFCYCCCHNWVESKLKSNWNKHSSLYNLLYTVC